MALDGVQRRTLDFDGDFGLEGLFQEHLSEEEVVDDDVYEEEDGDDKICNLEPLLFGELMMAFIVADNVARMKREAKEKEREAEKKKREAEERKLEAEQKKVKAKELKRRRKNHRSVIKSIREYDPKADALVWTRFPFEDFSTFDLDEESAVPPMRHIGEKYQTECVMHWSANILAINIVSSDVGFLINVFGTVIARDSLDQKCIYHFRAIEGIPSSSCQRVNH